MNILETESKVPLMPYRRNLTCLVHGKLEHEAKDISVKTTRMVKIKYVIASTDSMRTRKTIDLLTECTQIFSILSLNHKIKKQRQVIP